MLQGFYSLCVLRSLEESDGYNAQIGLDVFREDPDYQENEKKYEVGFGRLCQRPYLSISCAAGPAASHAGHRAGNVIQQGGSK